MVIVKVNYIKIFCSSLYFKINHCGIQLTRKRGLKLTHTVIINYFIICGKDYGGLTLLKIIWERRNEKVINLWRVHFNR